METPTTPSRPRLTISLTAGVLLAVYAVGYALLLLIFGWGLFAEGPFGGVFFLAMLALAATPFLALYWLGQLRKGPIGKAAWIMATVMAAPSLFWGYIGFGLLVQDIAYAQHLDRETLIFTVGPAVLSIFLCATFILRAWADRRKP